MNQLYSYIDRAKKNLTPEKDKIRDLSISFIHSFLVENKIKVAKVLGLSSAWWIFEKEMYKRFYNFYKFRIRAVFTSCERDYKIFSLASVRIPKRNKAIKQKWNEELNCYLITNGTNELIFNTDVFELMRTTDKIYNCIWLDLTTPLSYLKDKLILIGRVADETAVCMLTILKGREHESLGCSRVEFVSSYLEPLGFELKHSWEYFDSCPMQHLIYSRISTE